MSHESSKRKLMDKAIKDYGIDIQPCIKQTWKTSFNLIKIKGKLYLIFWFNSFDHSTHIVKTEIKKRG